MLSDFMETNIIIGYTVDWDRQSAVVQRYVDTRTRSVKLHTCSRVLDEAENVINDRRRLAKQAARLVFQEFDTQSRHPPVNRVVGFVRDRLSHKRNAAVDHVIQHIEDHEYYYTGLARTDSSNALTNTLSDIDSDFDDAITIVRAIRKESCSELDCTVFVDGLNDYSHYGVFSDVDRILSGSPNDRDILMDSYHLTRENGIEHLHFITMDGDLLENESQLEALLDPIDIESPDSLS